jgi:hypothetical protein
MLLTISKVTLDMFRVREGNCLLALKINPCDIVLNRI